MSSAAMSLTGGLRDFVSSALQSGPESWEPVALPGDASSRQYWRLERDDGQKFILMVMNQAEAFKSEEAQAQNKEMSQQELDFILIAQAWRRQGVRVPEIVEASKDRRYVVLEDFGTELLFDRRQRESAMDLYQAGIDELTKIQKLIPQSPVSDRRFQESLLEWECEHFKEYAIEKRNLSFSIEIERQWRDCVRLILDSCARQASVVVHRDFHSKNLCVLPSEQIGVIDFQDALMGPYTYDLVSLLRDAYVDLTEAEELRLLNYYQEQSGQQVDPMDFEAMALQRNLKAVGRFYYIWLVKKRATHLPFVEPCWKKAFKSLTRLGFPHLAQSIQSVMWGASKA